MSWQGVGPVLTGVRVPYRTECSLCFPLAFMGSAAEVTLLSVPRPWGIKAGFAQCSEAAHKTFSWLGATNLLLLLA